MRAISYLVLALVALPSLATAAPVIVHTDTSEVRACLPLAEGGALVGTGGGLVRVDAAGVRREVWTAVDGLPGTRIEALVADGDGLWVGADGGGARIDVHGATLRIAARFAGRPLRDVVRHAGVTYAATWEGGVVIVDGRRPRAVPFKGKRLAGRMRVAALASQGGTLWAGTDAGLYALRGTRLERVAIAGDAPEPAITGLVADGDRLWLATGRGLFVRDPDGVRLVGGGDLRRLAMIDGALVTADLGAGLRLLDRGRLVALPGGPGLVLPQALASHGGASCVGGLDGLWLRAASSAPWQAVAPAVGLPASDVSALAVDGDRLWVGTFDHGLAVRVGDAWHAVTDPDLDLRINALLVEPRPAGARLWVGTAAGLMILDGAADHPSVVSRLTRRDGLPGRSVMSLARLGDGRIVVGTSTGAALVGDGRVTPLGPPGQQLGNVWAVAEDADGLLWLGTTTGVWRGPATVAAKSAAADGWQRYSLATGHLHDDWVMALAVRGRSVWVGSYKGGVVRFDLGAAGAGAPLVATHLGDAWINPGGLAWDGARLLASTQDGLRVGDGATARWARAPGLPGKDVTAAVRLGATRWIATRRGLVEQPWRALASDLR